jgi:monoamine oxidase
LLLEALRQWGALDDNYAYKAGELTSDRRGFQRDPGGGLMDEAVPSEPLPFAEILRSRVWSPLALGQIHEFQSTIFEPVGGMDMIARAFVREIGSLIRYNAKVTAIKQDDKHVTTPYVDAGTGGMPMTASADWCLCTIPLSVLDQIDLDVGAPMINAINAVPYGAAAKIGLQFKRRFWEEDEQIYGYGTQIHRQYETDYENGIAVGWHRVPWVLGCFGRWTEEARKQHYKNLCEIDGRIALSGEHCSNIPAWQENAFLSALDAISRLHQRVMAG